MIRDQLEAFCQSRYYKFRTKEQTQNVLRRRCVETHENQHTDYIVYKCSLCNNWHYRKVGEKGNIRCY